MKGGNVTGKTVDFEYVIRGSLTVSEETIRGMLSDAWRDSFYDVKDEPDAIRCLVASLLAAGGSDFIPGDAELGDWDLTDEG
jgi:hypothetical protein